MANGLLQLLEVATFDEPQALMMNTDMLIKIKETPLPVHVDPLSGVYTVFGLMVCRAHYLPKHAIGIMEESAAKVLTLINNSGHTQTLDFVNKLKKKLSKPGLYIVDDVQYIVLGEKDNSNNNEDNSPAWLDAPLSGSISRGTLKSGAAPKTKRKSHSKKGDKND